MSPLVLPVATRALLEACRRLGLDVRALRDRAGLGDTSLDDPDLRIAGSTADAVWREAYAAAGDPLLAIHAAEQTPYGAFRVLDYLGASGATVGDGLRRVAAYFPLVDPRGRLTVEEAPDRVSVTFRGHQPIPPPAQEYTLAILHGRVRHSVGREQRAAAVRFTFATHADVGELRRCFGVEPELGSEVAALDIPREVFDMRAPSGDPALFAALDDHARRLLDRVQASDLPSRARAAITAELTGQVPSLALVARRLGLSPRSLQRRLDEAGTSFAEILDTAREERAKVFLRAGDVSIAEVSWLLGFAEQSAFTRAFRRWTGRAPTEWRRERGKAPSSSA